MAPGAPREASPRSTILLVDDDESIRRALQRLLVSEGYEVIQAASGREALSAVDVFGSSIGVLVSDVIMLGMHGDHLAKVVSRRFPHIAVLLMSAYPDFRAIVECGRHSDWAFLTKPFDMQRFLRTVADLAHAAK